MNFDPAQIGNYLYILAAWGAGFVLLLWLSVVVWTFQDVRRRTGSFLARFLATLFVLLFFLAGLVIYLILRPRHTLEEEYQQTLEEEALLQSIEDTPECPGCGRRIREDWVLCPSCHTKLRKTCAQCGRLMDLPWNICPYCATPTAEIRQQDEDSGQDLSSSLEINIDDALVNFDIIEEHTIHSAAQPEQADAG